MADETGKIKIGIEVDPSDAVEGLEKLQDELGITEDELKSLGKTTTKEAAKSGEAIEDSSERVKKALKEETEALKKSADAAEDTGKRKSKALNDPDDIKGLENIRDTTGEFDSAIKGAAGAVGLFSPKAERAMFVTGELAGGMEGASRLSMLFKGSMGALTSPLGLVAVGTLAVGAAIFAMTRDATTATLNLAHLEGALGAVDEVNKKLAKTQLQLRIERGDLTSLEADLVSVADTVRQEFAPQIAAASAPFEDFRENVFEAREELDVARRGLARMEGQQAVSAQTVAGIDIMRNRVKELTEVFHLHLTAAEEARDSDTSAADARKAVEVGIEKEIEARTTLLKLRISGEEQKDREQAARDRQAASDKAALKALKEQAEADAAAKKAMADRERVADLLAEAMGEVALIERQYARDIAEATRLQNDLGLSSEEAAELIDGALKKRAKALEALQVQEKEGTEDRATEIAQLVALEVSETEAIAQEYAQRQGELAAFLMTRAITEEQFAAKSIELEAEKNERIAALNRARAQETLGSIKMVTGQVTALLDAAIKLQTEKLLQEEEEALKAAGDDMAAQEKIRETFEKRRKAELGGEFRARKALEIANALISGASAAVAALAPPPVGLGPVAGPFLAGAIAATTAAQIAIISQQEPAFHQGGIVGGDGDRQITAQGGEVVLNRDAVAAMGGAAAADSLNRGGRAGGSVVVEMTYRGRLFDRMVVDNLAKGGPLKKALSRATKRGRRGRIGGRL